MRIILTENHRISVKNGKNQVSKVVMIRTWSSGPLFQVIKNSLFCRAFQALSNGIEKNWGGKTIVIHIW